MPDAKQAAKMIDAVRIYRQSDPSIRLFRNKDLTATKAALVLDTQDKSWIERFLSAAAAGDNAPAHCVLAHNPDTFYVILFDRDLLRTAHFTLRICEISGTRVFATIVPTPGGNWTILYNKPLVPLMMRVPGFAERYQRN